MTKYLRCHTAGVAGQTVGERYEVIHEDDRLYTIRGFGGYTKLPDSGGDSYRNWFILETDDNSENITVLPDESLNGTEREYREVNRKAAEGERIKIVKLEGSFGDYELGDVMSVHARDTGGVRTVETAGGWGGDGHIHVFDEEYTVLEPTDTVHLPIKGRISGTERFRMVDRKATIGDRVIVTDATGTRWEGSRHVPDYHNGDIFEIAQVNDGVDLATSTSGKLFYHREYRVLEPLTAAPLLSEQSAQDQAAATISALALRLETLEETVRRMGTDIRVAQEDIDIMDESIAYDVRKLEAEVAALKEAATTYSRTRPVTPTEVIASLKRHRTTQQNIKAARQQRRDDIVERAKADVKRLVTEVGGLGWETSDIPAFEDHGPLTIRFVVSRDKRTVAALAEWACFPGEVCERGTAKCAPGDVFNAHIGKAIALYRALGLEVPAEYLTVPKPTEVRMYDRVKYEGDIYTITPGEWCEHTHGTQEACLDSEVARHGVIVDDSGLVIDDTREEVAA
ncbi:hypothetical protein ABH892_004471 [Paenibacillus sp. RC254]|uniref:hypothetical protein n=1 Tax=unclassified Paenibacillus TaxID=185978 RepID=UPI0024B97A6B|nr:MULTISPECIES: hypothetical protein [unclassified Paenibacillus]